MASERVQRQIDRLLDQAEEAMGQMAWNAVRDCAKAVLGLDSSNDDVIAFLASAEQVLGTASVTSGPLDNPIVTESTTSSLRQRPLRGKALSGGGRQEISYLAQATLLDREVAFALIKTEGLDEVSRTRITREAQAMGRLGSHPHILTVFELGDHEGQPYMVTELMGGGDVSLLASASRST